MGREIRMVPVGWKHPKRNNGNLIPLHDGDSFDSLVEEWKREKEEWNLSSTTKHGYEKTCETYEEYAGGIPIKDDYMLVGVPDCDRTMLMMYESCSEGTPISPSFETPEELARWLTDNGASAFGSQTATYEQWLNVCKRGWAPSAMFSTATGMISGVAAAAIQKGK